MTRRPIRGHALLLSVFILASVALGGCEKQGEQCEANSQCLYEEQDVGKRCEDGYCVFPKASPVAGPNFCALVVNPDHAEFEQKHCLSQHRGSVTVLFFGQWLS